MASNLVFLSYLKQNNQFLKHKCKIKFLANRNWDSLVYRQLMFYRIILRQKALRDQSH